ncbi:FG-GAP repeat protein [candidate division KSB1 bacterium]|nr:FG-GAP repeat protein [candidate division KSB1 bacterium]
MKKTILAVFISLTAHYAGAQFDGTINLQNADVSFIGENAGDNAGWHISIAGDINDDGYSDILIGAPNFDAGVDLQNSGRVYLLFGKPGGWETVINLATANVVFTGEEENNQASHDVYGIGDVNNDGIDDLAIGVKFINESGTRAGKVYIFFGKRQNWQHDTPLADADAAILGEGDTSEAAHVYGAGDVNGDQIDDFIIGAGFNDDFASNAGKVYVFFGKSAAAWSKLDSVQNADASFSGEQTGDWAGHRVAGAGDVNGDGYSDFIIGANMRDEQGIADRGICYLVFGKANGWAKDVNLANADASFIGPDIQGVQLGWNIAGAGDVNGDGLDDILLAGAGKSKIYLIFGKKNGWGKNQAVHNVADVLIDGEDFRDNAGGDLRSLKDVNNDGYDDFIIGAYGNDQNGTNAGKAYLLYGRESWPLQISLNAADAAFLGEADQDYAGFSVAGGGDVNGDDYFDVLISANQNDDGGNNAGKVYLFFTTIKNFVLTHPNGGEMWEIGENEQVNWKTTDTTGTVQIELSRDNGATWEFIQEVSNKESANWEVTGPASEDCLVRITQVNDGAVDESNAPFSIVNPSITVISPNGGETWSAGEFRDIKWNSRGNMNKVKIEYSYNFGSTWTIIEDSTLNSGQYTWTVPQIKSNQCLIRIADARDGFPIDQSDNIFSISDGSPAGITIISPNGGENWIFNTDQNITWTSQDVDENVRIEYSADGGATWKIIINGTQNDGIFTWRINGPESDQCLIRVTAVSGLPSDISDAFFSIIAPEIPAMRIEAENMIIQAGLEIQNRSGASNDQVLAVPRNQVSGSALYRFADRPDGEYELWIRYMDEIDGASEARIEINGISVDDWFWDVGENNDFWVKRRIGIFNFKRGDKIILWLHRQGGEYSRTDYIEFVPVGVPSIETLVVNKPNGNENWREEDQITINWTSFNTSGLVKIELSRDSGASWETIAAKVPDSGQFLWTVTTPAAECCFVRISDIDGYPMDRSDNCFQITEIPEIIVTAPIGGEDWRIQTQQQITWQSKNTSGEVDISLSRDNGNTWLPLAAKTADDGTFDWLVEGPPSEKCIVRVRDKDGHPTGVSPAVFTISATPAIIITSPVGGENWGIGSVQTIGWASTNTSGRVNIELSRDNGSTWSAIKTNIIDNGGHFDWNVTGPAANFCLIRVFDVDGNPVGTSPAPFRISFIPTLTVLTPNGGESWTIGSTKNITWNSANTSGSVKIELSRNNGTSFSTIIASTKDDGVYNWPVDGPSSLTCLVRVSDVQGTVFDTSDQIFAIIPKPEITVTRPNGGERWQIGNEELLQWTSTATSGFVKIDLSRDNGMSWQTVSASAQDKGEYQWKVTGPASQNCLLRVSDANTGAMDLSNAAFSIVVAPDFTVTVPNGGEAWDVASEQTIRWNSTAPAGNVNIYLSRDAGANYSFLSSVADIGSWTWPVSGPPSDACLVLISNISGSPFDVSDAPFRILPAPELTVVSPNGGEIWQTTSQKTIRWTSINTSDFVDINLSRDNGQTWEVLAENVPDNGEYQWTVNAPASAFCRIQVSDADGSPVDTSDNVFTISDMPSITLSSPNGGEDWRIGTMQNITWESVNISEWVNIVISRDNKASWQKIESGLPNTGQFTWKVTGPSSPTCIIAISDGSTKPSDMSDSTFTISEPPSITVLTPNGGEQWIIGDQHEIKWSSVDIGNSLRVQLSKNNGGTWETLSNNAPNTGSWLWTVHEPRSDLCLVRITETATGISDTSDAVFTVRLESGVFSTFDQPLSFELLQNFPNPFNPVTRITYKCPKNAYVILKISDITGRVVRRLVDGIYEAGTHTMMWDGRDDKGGLLPSGIYFYTIKAEEFNQTNRMLFIR